MIEQLWEKAFSCIFMTTLLVFVLESFRGQRMVNQRVSSFGFSSQRAQ